MVVRPCSLVCDEEPLMDRRLMRSRRKIAMWQGGSPPGTSRQHSSEAISPRPDKPSSKKAPVVQRPSWDRKFGDSSTPTKKRKPSPSDNRTEITLAPTTNPPKRQLRTRTRAQAPRLPTRRSGRKSKSQTPAPIKKAEDGDSDMDAEMVASMLTDPAADVI